MADKLQAEGAGILAWLVRGAMKWYTQGLRTPSAVVLANIEYRSGMDSVGQFLEDCCEPSASGEVGATVLYRMYRCHANDSGMAELNQTQFGRALASRNYPSVKRGGVTFRTGLTYRTNYAGAPR